MVGQNFCLYFDFKFLILSLIFNFDFAGSRLRMAVGLVGKSGPAEMRRNIKRKVNRSGITSSFFL